VAAELLPMPVAALGLEVACIPICASPCGTVCPKDVAIVVAADETETVNRNHGCEACCSPEAEHSPLSVWRKNEMYAGQ